MTSSPVRVLLVLMILVVMGRLCVFRPASGFAGPHWNHGANATWLDVDWVDESKQQAEIARLADELKRHQIRCAFAFVSYLKPGEQFNPTYAYARPFARALKAADPKLSLQAWIGLPLNSTWILSSGGWVDLGNPGTRAAIAAFCARLIHEDGFDGIHLDPEPVASGDAGLLALLDAVRQAIGPSAALSIATPRIQPVLSGPDLPLAGDVFWRADYYRQVARRIDEVALMTYESALPLPALYRLWVRFQVIAISNALDGERSAVLIGVPTSREKTWTHSPSAENLASGLAGVVDGLDDASARPGAIAGVAIYPEWEMAPSDWSLLDRLWLGKSRVLNGA